jgi:HEAT repeat protein
MTARRFIAWATVLAAVCSCTKEARPPAADGGSPLSSPALLGAPPLAFRKTAELIADPELAGLVDLLAAQSAIESAAVGAAGAPSAAWKAYRAVVARATPADIVALLGHQRPVVRGYMAQHVARELPGELARLYPLLGDETKVQIVSGCMIMEQTIAEVVLDSLCAAASSAAAQNLLLRAAADGSLGPIRGRALGCVAAQRRAESRSIALALLDAGDPALRRDALMTLGMTGAVEDAARAASYAGDRDSMVRAQVATTLGRLRGPQARPVLEKLLRDSDDYVRRSAIYEYAALPDADPALIAEVLGDSLARVRARAAEGIARAPRPATIGLLEKYLGGGEALSSGELFESLEAATSPDVTDMMRRLLSAPDWYTRERAVTYLAGQGDTQSLPGIRLLLQGQTIGERQAAARAVARLSDRDAVPDLIRLLEDSNPNGRIAAAEALAALAARDAIPALETAVATDASWARPKLEEALRALRGGADAGP